MSCDLEVTNECMYDISCFQEPYISLDFKFTVHYECLIPSNGEKKIRRFCIATATSDS